MTHKVLTKYAGLRCKLVPGMFSVEWGVGIDLPDERQVVMFVDKELVEVEREPKPNRQEKVMSKLP